MAGTVVSIPNVAPVYGAHRWTEAVFGFGARSIAFVDPAASSAFAQLSMVPLLTLTAYYAPPGHRATRFALMASLMNIALVASQLQTKYLNDIFLVERGQYAELQPLLIWTVVLSFIIPVGAIALFAKQTVRHVAMTHHSRLLQCCSASISHASHLLKMAKREGYRSQMVRVG